MADPEPKPPAPVSLWTVFGVSLAAGLTAAGIAALIRLAAAKRCEPQPQQLVEADDGGEWGWVQ